MKGMVVQFHSFKGGTGKTMLTTNFAYFLSQMGQKVLLIDADLLAPSYREIITPRDENIVTWSDLLECPEEELEDNLRLAIQPTGLPNFDIIYSPPPQIGKSFLIGKEMSWWADALKVMLTKIKPFLLSKYEMIFLDNQNGISANSSNNIVMSDLGMLVLRPVSYGMTGTTHTFKELYTKLKGFLRDTERKNFLIWNQIPRDFRDNGLNKFADSILDSWDDVFQQIGLKTVARIDFNPTIALRMLELPQKGLLGVFPEIQQVVESICHEIGLMPKNPFDNLIQ
ncbi:MAG: AAA family ATPase [Candidatus Hermodarchaeota archaeon]